MPTPFTRNEKPVEATILDGLNFVSSTTLFQPSRKDQNNDLIHTTRGPFKPR